MAIPDIQRSVALPYVVRRTQYDRLSQQQLGLLLFVLLVQRVILPDRYGNRLPNRNNNYYCCNY